MTDLAASTIRYHSTALTLIVTLSRVMVSCCSAETVRVRISTETERSMPSGMIQYKPGPQRFETEARQAGQSISTFGFAIGGRLVAAQVFRETLTEAKTERAAPGVIHCFSI